MTWGHFYWRHYTTGLLNVNCRRWLWFLYIFSRRKRNGLKFSSMSCLQPTWVARMKIFTIFCSYFGTKIILDDCLLLISHQLSSIPSLAGTLISCELLTDVHQLCQQQPGGANDDTRPLQKYLLHGRGTKCLLALNLLGTQASSGHYRPWLSYFSQKERRLFALANRQVCHVDFIITTICARVC